MDGQLLEEISSALRDGRGVTKEKLLSIPSIENNPISERLIDSFTDDNVLDFETLLRELYSFASTSSLEPKLRLLFRIYDRNKQDRVSKHDLFHTLKMLNRHGLESCKIWNIVDKTFRDVGEYLDEMEFEDFSRLILEGTKNLPTLLKTRRTNQ